jgi:hypothetical protein
MLPPDAAITTFKLLTIPNIRASPVAAKLACTVLEGAMKTLPTVSATDAKSPPADCTFIPAPKVGLIKTAGARRLYF